jgi:YegS/Rv2252/BmrU family lipid kinase
VTTAYSSPHFIANPRSGRAHDARRIEAVHAEVRRRFPAAAWMTTMARGDATVLARSAARSGADLVVAVGGDGTINEVVNGLMDSEVRPDARPVLGILPAGSGSDFVRTLGIPHDPRAALDVLASGQLKALDVGEIECASIEGGPPRPTRWYFVNMAGCGSSARVAERFNSRKVHGTLGYAVAAALTALDYRFPQVDVALDGEPAHRVRLNLLFVCNGEYCGGGMHVGKGARVDDGLLYVVEVAGVSRLGSILQWPRLYTGSVSKVRGALVRTAQVVRIASDEDVLVDCDGDLCGRLPATYRVTTGALRVCVPG